MDAERPGNVISFGRKEASEQAPRVAREGGEVVLFPSREERTALLIEPLTPEALMRLPYGMLQKRMDALTSELAKTGEEYVRRTERLVQVNGRLAQITREISDPSRSEQGDMLNAERAELLREEKRLTDEATIFDHELAQIALDRENTYVRLISHPLWSEEAYRRKHETHKG